MSESVRSGTPVARLLGMGPVPIWSMTSAERLRRSLQRCGVSDVAPWSDGSAEGSVILMRADHVFDPGLVAALARAPDAAEGGVLLLSPEGRPVAAHVPSSRAQGVAEALLADAPAYAPAFEGMRAGGPEQIGDAHNKTLRKREVPYLMPLRADTVRAAEWRTFQGSYKGVTDLVTKYAWPVPASHVTRWCAAVGITPNQVTWLSVALVFLAMWLFWRGDFLLGLIAAWGMTFLDTVDGKLARVTLQSSKWGNILDHGTDLVHPPFWYWAWIAGLAHVGMPVPEPWWVLAVVLGGYVLQRLEEGLFIARFGLEMHVWRRFDSFFRLITARRNPNLLILTVLTLLGRPDWGILLVAAWTLASLLVHTAQVLEAGWITLRGRRLTSWLAEPGARW
ncbi:CDP-alcohol phosphatidyltransferase family protein [Roseomonas elaeocarpi]|uniref:CDP-alcohol phosphatidyltransferase family protein n=1 Tax=Roseomonas elaeocarpi TaxID=907779 RepID=A0ABV6JQM8_9PROT